MYAEDCKRIAELLPALSDGDLSPEEAAFVETHLETCTACRTEEEAQRRISQVLREEPLADVSLPTGAQAAAWIAQRERDARPWWLHLRLAWASLAAAAVVTAAVFFVAPNSMVRV